MKNIHYTMKARNAIQRSLQHIAHDDHIGIGCSGGADSMALLLGLSKVYQADRAHQVHVVIVDHKLQQNTDIVAEHVAGKAISFGFQPHIIPVRVQDSEHGVEAAAREARYQAFESIISEYDTKAFLTAHTKNDQAEQVFLGLLRGSGIRSLAGIPEQRDNYVRPFLHNLSRRDTEQVCLENKLTYWNDPHNTSPKFQRVNIRKLIHETEEVARQSIVEPLARTAQMSAEDADALDLYAQMAYVNLEHDGWTVDMLKNLPPAIRKRSYRKKILELGAKSDSVSFDLTNRVDEFVTHWRGQGEVMFTNRVVAYRENDALHFAQRD